MARELQSRFPSLNTVIEVADLSDPEAIQGLLRQLEAHKLHVDVLVNNVGLGESELFERSPWSRIRQIVEVNIVAISASRIMFCLR